MVDPVLSVNPTLTTNAAGMFAVEFAGLMQGTAQDSPTHRYELDGGQLAQGQPPLICGVPIAENIRQAPGSVGTGASRAMGGGILKATSLTGGAAPITGWSVFDQAHHALASPQSQVPLILPGQSVHFYRLGSRARIAVACDPALVNIDGQLITTGVSWDFVNSRLVAGVAGQLLPVVVLDVLPSGCMVTQIDGAGNVTWNRNGAAALIMLQ